MPLPWLPPLLPSPFPLIPFLVIGSLVTCAFSRVVCVCVWGVWVWVSSLVSEKAGHCPVPSPVPVPHTL